MVSEDPTRLERGPGERLRASGPPPRRRGDSDRPPPSGSGQLPAGRILAERYRIVSLLGSGGMGQVYRAEDLTLGASVALKVLAPFLPGDAQPREALLREVRLAREVTHANVCRVHDVGEVDGLLFLSMELIDGGDLASLIKRAGRLPSARAADIGLQIARGLAAIHDQGLLHLDLKPHNLLIDHRGRAKITDFGIAGRMGSRTHAGTLSYMPPEQQDGRPSVASDIYALGLVLFELVAGRRPFSGSAVEIALSHRDVVPTPPSAFTAGVDPQIERLILKCLEKDPARRPPSAAAVAEELAAAHRARTEIRRALHDSTASHVGVLTRSSPTAASGCRLRRWPPARLPEHPYPVLLPYTHLELLAGRRRELGELRRRLRMSTPIIGLYAASGVGKSSLLMGGLVPWLKASGWPVASTRFPWEPGLARRLLGDLVEGGDSGSDLDWSEFGDAMAEVARLSGESPVLVLDQVEELLGESTRTARAVAGLLLATTVQRRPGLAEPPCRWILAYRQEYHGEVVAWLADVLADARAAGLGPLDGLPRSLDDADRFTAMSLEPLGTAVAGADPVEEATEAFLAAIEAPLGLRASDGSPRYRLGFAPGHAERLATAFARTRVARPEAPLVPELQVVLAHLLAAAGPGTGEEVVEIRVPENADSLIGEALEDHLSRALEAAFPGADDARARARALLALRELAHATGRRQEGLDTATLARVIGGDGDAVLERLAAPDARLVVATEHHQGLRWRLSHDQLAVAVVRLVESEGRRGRLTVDGQLLALRRFIGLESALYDLRREPPDRLDRERARLIAANADALLFDEPRRRWWAACQALERARRRRLTTSAAAIAVALAVVATGTWHWAAEQAAHRALVAQIAEGEPAAALAALAELPRHPDAGGEELWRELGRRQQPFDVFERGLDGLPLEHRARGALAAAEMVLPMLSAAPDDPVLSASLVWAVDYAAALDPTLAGRARRLRDEALAGLRRHRPPPPLEVAGPDWVLVPGGTSWMGSGPGEGRDDENMDNERPRHEVTVSPFWLLSHEVTNRDFRRLEPDHPGDDDLPARVDWYRAYRYAAWLGGRLPTEAEWESAARAGCSGPWCDRHGVEAAIDRVAWWLGNAVDATGAAPPFHPVMQLEPNPLGLFDMLGNAWEWTADWYGPYPSGPRVDPVGPPAAHKRVLRGGSARMIAVWVQPAGRATNLPTVPAGFRVAVPADPDGRAQPPSPGSTGLRPKLPS